MWGHILRRSSDSRERELEGLNQNRNPGFTAFGHVEIVDKWRRLLWVLELGKSEGYTSETSGWGREVKRFLVRQSLVLRWLRSLI